MVAAAVAAGAFVAAGQGLGTGSTDGTASSGVRTLAADGMDLGEVDASDASDVTAFTGVGGAAPAPEILPLTRAVDTEAVPALAKGERIVAERAARETDAVRPRFVLPTVGMFTSGFGARWGTSHLGIDLANAIGTPILAVADGVVLESGPASGFGLWVRLGHADGTTTVYGHINRSLVEKGQEVRAGEEIAEMGNRGQSTGPHLHFEVWDATGAKLNPLTWLTEHGIELAEQL